AGIGSRKILCSSKRPELDDNSNRRHPVPARDAGRRQCPQARPAPLSDDAGPFVFRASFVTRGCALGGHAGSCPACRSGASPDGRGGPASAAGGRSSGAALELVGTPTALTVLVRSGPGGARLGFTSRSRGYPCGPGVAVTALKRVPVAGLKPGRRCPGATR